eukprot:GFYU01008661.1.p1 GENE.GFYU01008661.1~~GFYU01008661.1.p1  ORF type:complete len:101 (+),score=8.86 GFYU01008661.1:324-626(+)
MLRRSSARSCSIADCNAPRVISSYCEDHHSMYINTDPGSPDSPAQLGPTAPANTPASGAVGGFLSIGTPLTQRLSQAFAGMKGDGGSNPGTPRKEAGLFY